MIAINSNKTSRFVLLFASLMFFIAILRPSDTAVHIRQALTVCGNAIIPSLFPFTVLTGIITSVSGESGRRSVFSPIAAVLGISPVSLSAVFFGMLCGFPVGGKIAADLYKKNLISREEAERLIAYTNNTGPAFAIGAVGSLILGNASIGVLIYFTQTAVSLGAGIVLGKGKSPSKSVLQLIRSKTDIAKCICDASFSVISVCGFVVFFYFIVQTIGDVIPTYTLKLISALIFEVSCGATEAARLSSPAIAAAAAAFSVGWSGLSVHMQLYSFISGTDLKMKKYLTVKLISGIIDSIIVFLAVKLFPFEPKNDLSVFSYAYRSKCLIIVFGILIVFMISFVLSRLEKRKNMCYNVSIRRKRMCENEKPKKYLGN